MTLKKVVLPAPFGPISAVIEPSLTPRLARSTARMPPKRFSTPSASKIVPFPRLGARALTADPASFTEDHLLPLPERTLGPERHQPDEHEADDYESKRRDPGLGERQLEGLRFLEDRPKDHRADVYVFECHGAHGDLHRVTNEGDYRQELVRD